MSERGDRLVKEMEYFKASAKPVTAQALADVFGIARSTAQLDIEALRDYGCSFEVKSGNCGGYLLIEAPALKDKMFATEADIEIWNGIEEMCNDEQRRVLAYVLAMARKTQMDKFE